MATTSLLTLLLLPLLAHLASSDFAKDRADCENTLLGLASCISYVEGNAKAPTPDCCDGVGQVLAKNKTCVCILIKDRDEPDLGIKFNATLAMLLPQYCNHPTNFSECIALLGLTPQAKEAQIFEQFESRQNATSEHAGGGRNRYYYNVGGKKAVAQSKKPTQRSLSNSLFFCSCVEVHKLPNLLKSIEHRFLSNRSPQKAKRRNILKEQELEVFVEAILGALSCLSPLQSKDAVFAIPIAPRVVGSVASLG
ncbi:hypothetical protein Cni_G12922 [Canna indica]|uniref:Bifunctional inhibitor/plant lipid transfer protein/seed storage helical domain-containing protein n=1 Tax=Canna indica TaxID=4628 RepID=A0AAQ3QC85_9LILI|nr:hypothetical protein Cni_G12922 [Canna indica]